MFHVEHMLYLRVLILILSVVLVGCQKPEPMPELLDPIYKDFQGQRSSTQGDINDIQKIADDFKLQMLKAAPQTGQYKRFQKKYFEAANRVTQLKQQLLYWNIHIEERLIQSRLSYMKAYAEKKQWPDPAEYETYKADKKLRQAKIQWDQKERIKRFAGNSGGASAAKAPSGH